MFNQSISCINSKYFLPCYTHTRIKLFLNFIKYEEKKFASNTRVKIHGFRILIIIIIFLEYPLLPLCFSDQSIYLIEIYLIYQ
jgi:hypothetical protein